MPADIDFRLTNGTLRKMRALGVILAAVSAAAAQDGAVAQDTAALAAAERNEPSIVEEQIRLCEIPAPPFHEEARAREMERQFRRLGLENVRIDKAGNVIGVR